MTRPPASSGMGSWFSSIWRSAGPTIAAVTAVATGNPELAIPAAQAASATIKPKAPAQPQPIIVAPAAVDPTQAGGFLQAYQTLNPLDREIIVVGGVVLGAAVLGKLLFSGRR